MGAFPRDVKPRAVTYPKNRGSLVSVGQSGGLQTRSESAQGRIWTETWGVISAGDADVQDLLAQVGSFYNTGESFTITHYLLPGSGKTANGTATGSPITKAGETTQSGTSLLTTGWTASVTGIMKAGDCFTIADFPGASGTASVLFQVVSDADSGAGAGAATLTINPPIVVGSYPGASKALTVSGATMNAIVLQYSDTAGADASDLIGGFSVTFQEKV